MKVIGRERDELAIKLLIAKDRQSYPRYRLEVTLGEHVEVRGDDVDIQKGVPTTVGVYRQVDEGRKWTQLTRLPMFLLPFALRETQAEVRTIGTKAFREGSVKSPRRKR